MAERSVKVNGVEIDDDKTVPLDDDDWETILTVASGQDIENIVGVVLDLNVMRSARALGRLKKD